MKKIQQKLSTSQHFIQSDRRSEGQRSDLWMEKKAMKAVSVIEEDRIRCRVGLAVATPEN